MKVDRSILHKGRNWGYTVADLGGVRGVQLHPPLAGEVHFYACTT